VSQPLVKHSSNARFIQGKFFPMAQIGLAGDLGYAYRHFLHEHGSADDIAQHEGNPNHAAANQMTIHQISAQISAQMLR
jgi:hypothetical protein